MSTGSQLRDMREAAGLSKDELASMISIRVGLISQMEANDFSHCGGDTYARGHLKNIATRLGLEPDFFVEMYNSEHSLEHRGIHEQLVDNNVAAIPREPRKISWKVPALISVIVLVIAGSAQIVISNQSSTPAPTAMATPSPEVTVSATPEATISPEPTISPEATVSPEVTPAPLSDTGTVSLVLAATRGNSFINVIVDGKSAIKGSIFQGETKSYSAQGSISIYLSNPAGIDVTHNGKLLSPLGGQNQEVRRTFR
jgi:cytoskeletal protein RodZ